MGVRNMKNTSMEKWINSEKNIKKSARVNKNNIFYVDNKQIDEAVEMAFNENVKLPQIQEILRVLSTQ
jgi:hypothetical protein